MQKAKKIYQPVWDSSCHPARLEERLDGDKVRCHLSPRNCVIAPGKAGFCGVRMNVDGRLVSLNYGRATHVTQESIETEAVFHYAPGAPILSLGNIGCMMNCAYCHNWKTSQARLADAGDVHQYTPEQVVSIAEARGIPMLSWTYNDPVVWHEFVLDTARLGRERGLKNLYKSAFYISVEGAAELCEVIDIFSISIKSMDPEFYKRVTTGRLQPVLDAAKYVFDQGKHVEISMLMVTDANDRPEDSRALAEWVLENLSDEVPIHLVRFHPDYKYTHVGRTPLERLEAGRQAVLDAGVHYCYLGNVYDSDAVNTHCPGCGEMLIERYGLNARPLGLSDGRCKHCQRPFEFISWEEAFDRAFEPQADGTSIPPGLAANAERREFLWHGDIRALHVEAHNPNGSLGSVHCMRLNPSSEHRTIQAVPVDPGASYRFILSKSHPDETGVEIIAPDEFRLRLFEVYDRAHYPTMELEVAQSDSDAVPLPRWEGNPFRLPIVSQ